MQWFLCCHGCHCIRMPFCIKWFVEHVIAQGSRKHKGHTHAGLHYNCMLAMYQINMPTDIFLCIASEPTPLAIGSLCITLNQLCAHTNIHIIRTYTHTHTHTHVHAHSHAGSQEPVWLVHLLLNTHGECGLRS